MKALDELHRRITCCRRCPRLVRWREASAKKPPRRYLGMEYWAKPLPGFGDPKARVLIVGLAPAAHGGNRTGRMFTGDRSGDWLYEALFAHGFANQPESRHAGDGLVLYDTWITAAARCAPPDNRPTPEEFARCRPYLVSEMRLLPLARVVLALGALAWDQWLRAYESMGGAVPRPRPRHAHGAELGLDSLADAPTTQGLTLLGSYHPSQQNTLTG